MRRIVEERLTDKERDQLYVDIEDHLRDVAGYFLERRAYDAEFSSALSSISDSLKEIVKILKNSDN